MFVLCSNLEGSRVLSECDSYQLGMAADPAISRQAVAEETLSRGEICRRYALFGMESFGKISPAYQERLAHKFQASMEAGEERLKHRQIQERLAHQFRASMGASDERLKD